MSTKKKKMKNIENKLLKKKDKYRQKKNRNQK